MKTTANKTSKLLGTCSGCNKAHEVRGGLIVEHKSVWKHSTGNCHGSSKLPVEIELAIKFGCIKAEMLAA